MQGRTTTLSLRLPAYLVVPGLIGLTLGLYGPATIDRFETLFQPLCSLADPALLAMLAASALGMWLPNRFARAFSRIAARVHRRLSWARTEPIWDDLSDPTGVDAQLKIIGAGSLVLCGLAVMWLNTMAAGVGHLDGAALETFHWTRLTLGLLVTTLIGMYVALPLVCSADSRGPCFRLQAPGFRLQVLPLKPGARSLSGMISPIRPASMRN